MLLQNLWVQESRVETIPYSEFESLLKAGQIAEIVVTEHHIRGILKEPADDGKQAFVTTRIDPELARDFAQYGVTVTGAQEQTWLRDLLGWMFPMLLFLGIWFFVIRRFAASQGLGGGYMALGKSKAKVYMETDTKVTFEDVAGVDEAKDELKEIIEFLEDPGRYGRLGGRVPKGVLLVGPPGTGKTLLARAVAGEAGVAFFSISGSEFVEMFVGLGAARVRDLFEQARQQVPCIIFIDELDALGRARGSVPGLGGHDENGRCVGE